MASALSATGAYYALHRNGMNRLPQYQSKRGIGSWCRYEKTVPGHHVQVDVKFVDVLTRSGKCLRRFQYTAIDDATRIRALQLYPSHTQASAIAFLDYVVEKFPLPDPPSPHRSRPRVSGAFPLARGGPRQRARVHPAADTSP